MNLFEATFSYGRQKNAFLNFRAVSRRSRNLTGMKNSPVHLDRGIFK